MFDFSPTTDNSHLEAVKLIESGNFTKKDVENSCKYYAEAFSTIYYEKYRLVRGYIQVDSSEVMQEHWWCEDKRSKAVYDPTVSQFNGSEFRYTEVFGNYCRYCSIFIKTDDPTQCVCDNDWCRHEYDIEIQETIGLYTSNFSRNNPYPIPKEVVDER